MTSVTRFLLAFSAFLLAAGCAPIPAEPRWVEGTPGCWANFYADTEYRPPVRAVTGPTHVESISGSFVADPEAKAGEQFRLEEADSLLLGPAATLVGYQESLFRKQTLVLKPRARVPDLHKIRFHEHVESFQLLCE